MNFYDSVNKRAICQEIDRLCDTTDTSYPRLDKTARANDALETIVGWIIGADGTFQFDDTNYSSLPRGKGTLVEGQEWYSFASEYLEIDGMQILDLNNKYIKIELFDEDELGMSWEEYFGVTSAGAANKGFPRYYDLIGDSFRLGPAPTSTSVTLANGVRILFKRTASLFTPVSTTAADTTEPGFASPFHVTVAHMAARPFCLINKPERVSMLNALIGDMTTQPSAAKKEIIKFYSHRETDKRKIMTMKSFNYL